VVEGGVEVAVVDVVGGTGCAFETCRSLIDAAAVPRGWLQKVSVSD